MDTTTISSRTQLARDALAQYRQWEADDTLSPDLPTSEVMGKMAAALELLLEAVTRRRNHWVDRSGSVI